MDIQPSDLVRTSIGVVGEVVHVQQMTAFVAFPANERREIKPYLLSEIEKDGGQAIAVECDVAKAADVRRALAKTIEALGRLDFAK